MIESRLQDEHAADWAFAESSCQNPRDGHVVVNEGMGHARISRGAVVTQAQELLLILWLQFLECCEDGQLSGSARGWLDHKKGLLVQDQLSLLDVSLREDTPSFARRRLQLKRCIFGELELRIG